MSTWYAAPRTGTGIADHTRAHVTCAPHATLNGDDSETGQWGLTS